MKIEQLIEKYIGETSNQKIKMKATGKIGYLTGRTKKLAGKIHYQIMFPWSDEDNKDFENYHGKKRSSSDKGIYEYHREVMFDYM